MRDWEAERAVSGRAKAAAVILLLLSWAVLARLSEGPLVPAVTGLLFSGVAMFLITRPTPRVPGGRPIDD